MSVSAYARHRRCSRVAVYKAVQTGRITREPDGTIDPAKADAQWSANTSPASRWAAGSLDVALSEADIDKILGG